LENKGYNFHLNLITGELTVLISKKLSLDKKCQEMIEKMSSLQEYKTRPNEAKKQVQEMRKMITELETEQKLLLRHSRKSKTERKDQKKIVLIETRCQFHQHLQAVFHTKVLRADFILLTVCTCNF